MKIELVTTRRPARIWCPLSFLITLILSSSSSLVSFAIAHLSGFLSYSSSLWSDHSSLKFPILHHCGLITHHSSFLFFITVVWSLITQVSYSSSLWSDHSSLKFPILHHCGLMPRQSGFLSYSSSLWSDASSVGFPILHHCGVLIPHCSSLRFPFLITVVFWFITHHSGFWWIVSQVSFLHHCGLMPHLSGFLSSSLSSDLSSLGFSFLFFITVVWSLRFPFLFIIGFPIPHHLGGGCLGIQKGSSLLHHSGVLSDSSSPRWPYAADKTF